MKHSFVTILILSVLFAGVFPLSLPGQEQAFLFYTPLNSNMSGTVYDLIQDKQGYIWFATADGVFRYDGLRFHPFTTDDGLADNEILHVREDSKGRIWFLSLDGFPAFFLNGRIFSRRNSSVFEKFHPRGHGSDLLEDSKGNLWFVNSQSLIRVGNDLSVRNYSWPWLSENNEIWGAFLHQDKCYFVTSGGVYDAEGDSFICGSPEEVKKLGSTGKSLPPRLWGNSWYFPLANYVIEINISHWPPQYFGWKQGDDIRFQGIGKDPERGIFLFATQGTHYLDTLNHRIHHQILKRFAITNMIQDREGNYWYGTLGNGAILVTNPEIQFWDSEEGIQDNQVYNVSGNSPHEIIIGFDQFRYDIIRMGDIFPLHAKTNTSRQFGKSVKIRRDGKGGFILANELMVAQYNRQKALIPIEVVSKDAFLNEDGYWLTVSGRGVTRFNTQPHPRKPGWLIANSKQELFSEERSFCILKTENPDSFLLGTTNGLKVLEIKKGIRFLKDAPIFHERILDIGKDKKGFTWFCTSNFGACAFRGEEIYVFDQNNGLSSGLCRRLFIDEHDVVWIATTRGLNRISTHEEGNGIRHEIHFFDQSNGLITDEINDVFVISDTVFCATPKGLLFFPASLREKSIAPFLVMEEIRVDGQPASVENLNKLPYDKNSIEFEFGGISIRSRGKVTFQYRLNRPGGEWQETPSKNILLSDLSPGSYLFEVRALNASGLASEPLSVRFSILAPIWKRSWFIALSSTLLLISVVLIFIFRNREIERKHALSNRALIAEKEKTEYEKQLSELEQKALRLQMNPHFIFNSINAIQGFYAEGDIATARRFISVFSSLLRRILEHSTRAFISLDEDLRTIHEYIQLLQLRFEGKFTYEIQTDGLREEGPCGIPPLIIQPFVENAIQHGLIPMRNGGKLIVKIKKEKESLFCSIEDNGIGIQEAMKRKIGTRHNSKGVSVTQERIRTINSQYGITGEFLMEDMQPQGTRVSFRIASPTDWEDTWKS